LDGAVVVVLDRAIPSRTIWLVGGINVSDTAPATVKAIAYCAAIPSAAAANAAADRAYVDRMTKKLAQRQ
jgi:hypothetical protein